MATGARLAWIPRRAGERGAIEAGCAAQPAAGRPAGGRPGGPGRGGAELGKSSLPAEPGRDTAAMLAAAAAGELGALVIVGCRPGGPARSGRRAARARDGTPFVVSLELRASAVTDRADVVFPVAAAAEKAGTFVNWEGRGGTFGRGAAGPGGPHRPVRARRDRRRDGRAPRPAGRRRGARGARRARHLARHQAGAAPPGRARRGLAGSGRSCRPGQALLATWRQLLDSGRMQDGEPSLAGTARPVVARMSAATAAEGRRGRRR